MLKEFVKQTPFGLALLLLFTAVSFVAMTAPIEKRQSLIVRGGSMQPTLSVGDMIIVKNQNRYQVGDVVAFRSSGSKSVITHRISSIEDINGNIYYQTKGDANEDADINHITTGDILGKAQYKFANVGKILAFSKTKKGIASIVIIPAAFVTLLELFNIYKEIKKRNASRYALYYSGPMGLAIVFAILLIFPARPTYAFFTDTVVSTNNTFTTAQSFPSINPVFPPCPEGGGIVKEFYPEGWHWILGIEGNQFGADKVFNIGDNNFIQCYFPPNGTEGIQTNWFAANNLTQEDIDDFVSQGWTFVTEGYAWGLPVQFYLAKNQSFTFTSPPTSSPPSSSPGPGDVVINEINWAGSSLSTADEWIELKNTSAVDIDISGWVVENLGNSTSPNITIDSGVIPANGYFLISNYNEISSKINVIPDMVTADVSLSNTGEQLILKDQNATIIDTANNAGGWFAGENSTPEKSMERKSPQGDGTQSANWQTATTHTNMDGSSASDEFGTPKSPNGL